jgi:lipopolysaccharide heptosyltransferase II
MAIDRWADAKNLLCVRLDTLGDVLLTTPALRALKESAPDRRITLLTSPSGAAAAELVPQVDRVLTYDAPWMKATGPRPSAQAEFELIEQLRAEQFDGAVVFTVYSQNPLPAAFACYLAGIPRRLAHCRENPYQLLSDWIPEIEPEQTIRHEVRRQLDLVAAIGCRPSDESLALSIPAGARARVSAALRRSGVDCSAPWLLIHPGATAPSRRYPPEHFARVSDLLFEEHGLQAVFTGTASERELIDSIRDSMQAPAYSLAGRLNLGELAAALQMALLLIANNTGPVHVAAAVGAPVVDLYALTNPQHTPWQVPHRVLSFDVPCKYCYKSVCPQGHHACLREISPESVVAAAVELLEQSSWMRRARPAAIASLEGTS